MIDVVEDPRLRSLLGQCQRQVAAYAIRRGAKHLHRSWALRPLLIRGFENEERVNWQIRFVGMEPEAGSKTDGDSARLIVREPLNVRAALTLGARDRHRGTCESVSDDRTGGGDRYEERDDNSAHASFTFLEWSASARANSRRTTERAFYAPSR